MGILFTADRPPPIIMDGAMGSELELRHIEVPKAPWWTAWNTKHTPEAIEQIHRDYVQAGATIHTTNTFRSKRINIGDQWRELTKKAYDICHSAIPKEHLVAGSIAPLSNCYDSTADIPGAYEHHKEMATFLAKLKVDILLCETFCALKEAYAAIQACVETGVETWVSFTAGPYGELLSHSDFVVAVKKAKILGASCVLLNCTDATKVTPFLLAIADIDIQKGVFANAGDKSNGIGWGENVEGPKLYADLAKKWYLNGADVIGGCCGTRPAHINAIYKMFYEI
jgi:S-methylmethionine-dependent homocysteine/selenocysteine methylase